MDDLGIVFHLVHCSFGSMKKQFLFVCGWPPDLSPPVFSPEGFLYGLLPPIVYGAGFSMKKRPFFQNFGAITMFAVMGTVISTVVFSVFTILLTEVGVINKHSIGSNRGIKCFMYGKYFTGNMVGMVCNSTVRQENAITKLCPHEKYSFLVPEHYSCFG